MLSPLVFIAAVHSAEAWFEWQMLATLRHEDTEVPSAVPAASNTSGVYQNLGFKGVILCDHEGVLCERRHPYERRGGAGRSERFIALHGHDCDGGLVPLLNAWGRRNT